MRKFYALKHGTDAKLPISFRRGGWGVRLLFLYFVVPLLSSAQDVEQLVKSLNPKNLIADKSIKVSGGVSMNAMHYQSWNNENRLIPFNYNLAGNLNVSILGKINMPVSFSYANQNATFTNPFTNRRRFAQPFNRLQLQPSYRGLKLYLGTAAQTFSAYTLAGHRYDGVGLEYRSDKSPIYGGIMVGTLLRAIPIDREYLSQNNQPAYKRTGMGMKVGYKHEKDLVEVIFFKAEDKPRSLAESLDTLGIRPRQNAVMSVQGAKAIGQNLFIRAEVAVSGLTQDVRAMARPGAAGFGQRYGGLLDVNSTTVYRKALSGGIDYAIGATRLGAEYSRVDPDYETLGAYYFNSDLQTWSVKAASSLLNNKISLGGSLGYQQDNLDGRKFQTATRWVGSGNVSYTPSPKLNFMVNYSTFQNYSNLRSDYDFLTQITPYNVLDTLDYRQINQNLGLNTVWQLPSASEKNKKNLMLNFITQANKDKISSNSALTNTSLAYSQTLEETGWGYQAGMSYSSSRISGLRDKMLGPTVGLNKAFGELNTALTGMWSRSHSSGELAPGLAVDRIINVTNLGCRVGYTLNKVHALQLNIRYMIRNEPGNERLGTNFSELSTTVGYNYKFNATLWKK